MSGEYVTGYCTRLPEGGVSCFYSSLNVIRVIKGRWGEMDRACGCMGDRRSVYMVCRDSMKARDFLECKTLVLSRRRDWIDLAQDLDNW
jgi:hypothetical protein